MRSLGGPRQGNGDGSRGAPLGADDWELMGARHRAEGSNVSPSLASEKQVADVQALIASAG